MAFSRVFLLEVISVIDLHWPLWANLAAIAASSVLYFTISVLTDASYRAEFLDELREEMHTVLCDRQGELKLLAADPKAD